MTPNFFFTVKENQNNKREKTISVKRCTKEEFEKLKGESEKAKRSEFEEVLGFSKVWKDLINFKKPVVGHNCFLDLLFCFEHFHKNNPFSFPKFKETVTECWPMYFPLTKHLRHKDSFE